MRYSKFVKRSSVDKFVYNSYGSSSCFSLLWRIVWHWFKDNRHRCGWCFPLLKCTPTSRKRRQLRVSLLLNNQRLRERVRLLVLKLNWKRSWTHWNLNYRSEMLGLSVCLCFGFPNSYQVACYARAFQSMLENTAECSRLISWKFHCLVSLIVISI